MIGRLPKTAVIKEGQHAQLLFDVNAVIAYPHHTVANSTYQYQR